MYIFMKCYVKCMYFNGYYIHTHMRTRSTHTIYRLRWNIHVHVNVVLSLLFTENRTKIERYSCADVHTALTQLCKHAHADADLEVSKHLFVITDKQVFIL